MAGIRRKYIKKATETRYIDKDSAGGLWKERGSLISMFIQC